MPYTYIALRRRLSPRHVPDEIIPVDALPYTPTGKRLEVPVKRILGGTPLDEAVDRQAVRNPKALDFFANLARPRE